VGCGGAARALDRGWEATAAAVDDEQELRRSSGGAARSGRRRAVKMWVRECKRECTGSSRMCFKLRRRHGEREQVLAADDVRGGRGRSSGRGGEAWNTREKTAGRTRAAAGRGATRGGCQKQEVAPVGLQRR
jgi:hypothetical protein